MIIQKKYLIMKSDERGIYHPQDCFNDHRFSKYGYSEEELNKILENDPYEDFVILTIMSASRE